METITVATFCPFCGKTHEVEVPFEGFCNWKDGMTVQDAFPNLSADEREMLISGICSTCWNKMFA